MSKQQLSVPACSSSPLYIKAIHLCSMRLQIYHPRPRQLPRTLTLPLIPPSVPMSLWLLFQAISYPLRTKLVFSGFDPQWSLKDLVCTDPLALLMPGHDRKILLRHLPLAPKIQDWICAHLQEYPTETPWPFRQLSKTGLNYLPLIITNITTIIILVVIWISYHLTFCIDLQYPKTLEIGCISEVRIFQISKDNRIHT